MTDLRTTSLPPTNSSMEMRTTCGVEIYFPLPDHVALTIIDVTLLICPLGLVGNGIVLWFLGFRIKRSPFTVYVLNLAAADFGFLLCLALSRIILTLLLFDILMSFNMLLAFTFSASLSLLTAISVERCISVLFPVWYRCHRPKHLSAIICAMLWAVLSLIGGLRAYVCFSSSWNPCYMVLIKLTGTIFLIFTPITVLSSLILIIKVRQTSLRHQPRKLYIAILLNVLFFLFLVAPCCIVVFFRKSINYNHFINSFLMLSSINSSINPIIYFLVGSYRNQQFRGSLKKALQKVFEEEADTREESVTAT